MACVAFVRAAYCSSDRSAFQSARQKHFLATRRVVCTRQTSSPSQTRMVSPLLRPQMVRLLMIIVA